MASLSHNRKSGLKTIQFIAADGRRRSLRLGKIPMKTAREVKTRVEYLNAARIAGHVVDDDTVRWLHNIDDSLSAKLAAVGLISGRENATLAEFVSGYIKKHGPTVKPATVVTWRQCERLLLEYFDPGTPLRDITEGQAVEWRNYLQTRGNSRVKGVRKLAEPTIRKRCACARQFFEHALRLGLINRNPFKSKRIPTTLAKPAQKAFVSSEMSSQIMEHLPNWEYRLLFALARWGGVRVPSEPRALTWCGVDWDDMKLTIHSPKTEHHEGHEKRIIPIFPELVQPLQEAWDAAQEGESYVLPMLKEVSGAALRKPLLAAIRAAGCEPWKKLWTALRATRDTELRESFPSHVVEAWLGHEDRVSKRNYAQVTDEHFRRAAKSGARALQNAVQHPTAGHRTTSQPCTSKPTHVRENASHCDSVPIGAISQSGDERT